MCFLSQKISKPVFCSTSVWQVLWGTAPQTDLSCIDDGFHSEGCSNLKKEQELKKKKLLIRVWKFAKQQWENESWVTR